MRVPITRRPTRTAGPRTRAGRRRKPAAPLRLGAAALCALLAYASGRNPAHAAATGIGIGGGTGGPPPPIATATPGTVPTPPPHPLPTPTPGPPLSGRPGPDIGGLDPGRVLAPRPCATPAPIFSSCAPGERRIDEVATRHFNTTLMRGCGRFVLHELPGNAEIVLPRSAGGGIDPFGERHDRQVPVRPDLPRSEAGTPLHGLPDGDRLIDLGPSSGGAWVLALRGCGLDTIERIEIAGGGVTASVIEADDVRRWIVPLSPPSPPAGTRPAPVGGIGGSGGTKGLGPLSTALVRLTASPGATPATDRRITVHFGPGTAQELKFTVVTVARNGAAHVVRPASARWEDPVRLRFTGTRIGNAALAGPACAREARVASGSETSLEIDTVLWCPRSVTDPVTGEVDLVNRPRCDCLPIAYDGLLSIYPEIGKQPFSYLKSDAVVAVGPNLDYLGRKPGAIGDSLSQGVYGVAVKPASQLWAYPHLVVARMGGAPMSQNLIKAGPGPEDGIKTFLSGKFGPAPDPIVDFGGSFDEDEDTDFLELRQASIVGLFEGGEIAPDRSTTEPLHTGVSGMDYTNVLRTSGRCLDETADGLRPVTFFDVDGPDVAYDAGTETPDLAACTCPNGGAKPWAEVQLGLACGSRTPIEILEAARPTFVFASAAANHFLSCAVHGKARDCVEMARFLRDSSETFRRLRRIGSVRGGVVFGVPPLGKIPYLERQTSAPAGLRAFWKRSGEADTAAEVMDGEEEEFLTGLIDRANEHLRTLAGLNGYAFVDATEAFGRLDANGVPIVDPATGNTMCRARPRIATRTIDRVPALLGPDAGNDAGCGMMSLDGVHPNQLGHAIMANEIVRGIDAFYGLDVPALSPDELFAIWEEDTLNQDPIDMRAFMQDESLTECLGLAAGELAALGLTAPVCMGTGAFCVESLAILFGGGAVVTQECTQAALVDLAIRPAFQKVDRTPAPQWCWGGVDEGRCRFENADGERLVTP